MFFDVRDKEDAKMESYRKTELQLIGCLGSHATNSTTEPGYGQRRNADLGTCSSSLHFQRSMQK